MNKQKTIHDREPQEVPRGRAKKQCHCGKWFTLPTCHASRHKSCSDGCKAALSEKRVRDRERACAWCGSRFIPRSFQVKVGQGGFCSVSCSTKAFSKTEQFKRSREKSGRTYRESLLAGQFVRLSGESHPQWSGGPAEARKRRVLSGKSAEYRRRYVKENPERVREWTQKRSIGYSGRLPRGTIAKLHRLQRGMCAFCNCSLDDGYHVDHILPIALGGKHEPLNIQLLCPTCNVRKWAFHPVEFANKNGRLL